MPRITVTPAYNSYKNTGGLCGMWNDNRNQDLYVLNNAGVVTYTSDVNQLKEFWKLDSKWSPALTGKREEERCPECFLQAERRLYCPCDDFSLTNELTNNVTRDAYCEIPMPNCVEKSLNLPVTPIDNNNNGGSTTPPPTRPPISPEDALILCTNGIVNNTGLNPIIAAGAFNPNNAIYTCVQDLVLTGNTNLIQLHVDLSINQALQDILQNDTYYQNGTITDAGIALLIHLCPGGCGGNGACLINVDCLSARNKNVNDIGDCLSPVYCSCNTGFGGPSCGLNILEPPDFFLSKTCCDVRNYDCDLISGFGYPLARKSKLYYMIIFSETDNIFTFDNTVTGLANIITDNEFTFPLPLNNYWLHNTSFVDVTIGISYDGVNYKYQSLQLFDSKCRFCNVTVSNEAIKDDTCLIDNICYADGENELNNVDNICDVTLNPFEWTFIGYIPPFCNNVTHEWSNWYNLDDPSGDGDLEILPLVNVSKCDSATEIEVFTVDDIPADKVNQVFYRDRVYGFICQNKDQVNGDCLDYKIRLCCPIVPTTTQAPITTDVWNTGLVTDNFTTPLVVDTTNHVEHTTHHPDHTTEHHGHNNTDHSTDHFETTTGGSIVTTYRPDDCTRIIFLQKGPILVDETSGFVRITISVTGNCSTDRIFQVDYHTEPHTATGEDIVLISDSVIFLPGETSKNIDVTINDNNLIQPFRFFTFIIDSVYLDNYFIENNELLIYIRDDDYNRPGAQVGPIFDLLTREHAERNINIAIFLQTVKDVYTICPSYGGINSSLNNMELFFEFLDNYYDLYTVEVNNPGFCNVKALTGYLMDRFGTALTNEALEYLSLDGEVFIDIKYSTEYAKPIAKNDDVEAILVTFDETYDASNPTNCELRLFGRANSKKINETKQ